MLGPQDVSNPIFVCDSFSVSRMRGNPCAVCFCPSNVYNSSWSEIESLESSCGRGEPSLSMSLGREEQERKDEAYAKERDMIMGDAFQKVAAEMQLSETCFVYRLPSERIKAVKELIRQKVKEFNDEHAENKKHDEEFLESELLKFAEGKDSAEKMKALNNATTFFKGGLIPTASFLGCLESSMSMSSFSARRSMCKRINAQWFGLRWFTPVGESSMCGHGTVAAAHCLFESSQFARQQATRKIAENIPSEFFMPAKTDVICFVTELGIVTVRRHEASTALHAYRVRDPLAEAYRMREVYEVHFPSNDPISVKKKFSSELIHELFSSFSLSNDEATSEKLCLDIAFSPNMSTYIIRLPSVRDVLRAEVNITALKTILHNKKYSSGEDALVAPRGIILSAENKPGSPDCLKDGERGADAQVISRFFEPWQGVSEDPVSGSAHTIIAPYWLRTMHGSYSVGDKITCYQASERGGYVPCIIIGKKADRVALMGSCVTSVRGNVIYEVKS